MPAVKRLTPIAAWLLPEWLDSECELHPSHFETAGRLYDSWRHFARGRRAEPGSPPEFARAMELLGFTVDQLAGDPCRIRWGLRLRLRLPAGAR